MKIKVYYEQEKITFLFTLSRKNILDFKKYASKETNTFIILEDVKILYGNKLNMPDWITELLSDRRVYIGSLLGEGIIKSFSLRYNEKCTNPNNPTYTFHFQKLCLNEKVKKLLLI